MICEKCQQDKPDVMVRSDVPPVGGKPNPPLCTSCCAEMPGRAWMKANAS